MIMGYADWNGNIDSSTKEVPVFVYAETTWKAENLFGAQLTEIISLDLAEDWPYSV